MNPCGDPPGGRGGSMTPPTAEGGALRSQDVRTTGDPTGLDGTILRVNPDTGAAMPDNPNAGSSDLNARRIVAHGFRNPFRITVRPGTNEIWAGDVGWNTWEEIDRLQTPTAGVKNFGWPCYEGDGRQGGYDSLDLNLCESLYSQGASAVSAPYYTYNHGRRWWRARRCPTGGSSISGLAFYDKTRLPGPLPQRPLLRGLHAQLHLGDAPRRERAARPGQARDLRGRRGGSGGPPGGSRAATSTTPT